MQREKPENALVFAKRMLLLLLLSLAVMQPAIQVLGFAVVATDFIFIACLLALLCALITGQSTFRWQNAYWLLGFYLAALVVSGLASDHPRGSIPKLLTQVYLLSLPVLICNLIQTREDLRAAFEWWLAGTALVAAVAIASLFAFMEDPNSRLLDYTRSHYGTLPPGDYLRLRLTFLNANMACNYLTVSVMLLLIARKLRWIGKANFLLLLAGILLSAVLTISPGLGGLALAVSTWIWFLQRGPSPLLANLSLVVGLAVALMFVGAMSVTPIIHPTAPFLLNLPILDVQLAPSGRLMIWIEATRNFLADPFFGRGIGAEAAHVRFQDPSGDILTTTDAHNTFLSIAVQSGIIGLGAIIAIIVHVHRRAIAAALPTEESDVFRVGLSVAFLVAFAYGGLGGSFEDARHLWATLGLFLAAERIHRVSPRP